MCGFRLALALKMKLHVAHFEKKKKQKVAQTIYQNVALRQLFFTHFLLNQNLYQKTDTWYL